MNEKFLDFLVCVIAIGLLAWGCYRIYPPTSAIAVGVSLLYLVRMARSGN